MDVKYLLGVDRISDSSTRETFTQCLFNVGSASQIAIVPLAMQSKSLKVAPSVAVFAIAKHCVRPVDEVLSYPEGKLNPDVVFCSTDHTALRSVLYPITRSRCIWTGHCVRLLWPFLHK